MIEDGASEEYYERLVNEEKLQTYLEDALGPTEEFDVHHHPEGHSNETLFVTWGSDEIVIRRPPPGETADKAHDVLREYRILSALQETDVPVATTLFACDDHDILGCDFYGVERVSGTVLRAEEPETFSTNRHRRMIGEQLVDTLVSIHQVDYEAVGLGELGHPEGFTARQVDRWEQQFEWAAERTSEVRSVPALLEVSEWLQTNRPDSHDVTLVHGDFKLDNVMFAPEAPPTLNGVFDWELSTVGDPLTDLGWLLAFWYDSGDPEPAVPALMPTFMARDGYLSRRELVDRYEHALGVSVQHERFYRTLAVFKLAALGEMFFRRYLEGNSDDPLYPKMEDGVPRLAAHAERIIDDTQTL